MKVDVVIPLKNTGHYWKDCLDSLFREIPINRLLVGDGGCTDDSIEIVKAYPNVIVFDHSKFKSQGYCIRRLIENVETEWFVYLHSDVLLPKGWFKEMVKYCDRWDWFECKRIGIYPDGTRKELKLQFKARRAYSGSQMGKTKVLKQIVSFIQDDYIRRTEDIIIQQILQRLGYKYGKASTTFHYHFLKAYDAVTDKDRIETILSFIKYLEPTKENRKVIQDNIKILRGKGILEPLILDIGCGERPQGTINIDVRKTKAINVLASASNLPFQDEIFYQVFCSEVLEHLKNPTDALKEIKQVLVNGGVCEITVPTKFFTSNIRYHLLRFFLNTLLCPHPRLMWKEIKWLLSDLEAVKQKDVARMHRHIVTGSLIQKHFRVAREEYVGHIFLASLEARFNSRFRNNVKFSKLPSGVLFVCYNK